jgi:hypothetical protein
MKTLAVVSLSVLISGPVLLAQSVISAKSGLVHYVEGDVQSGGAPVVVKTGSYVELKEKQTLTTREGRAEVLLTPGALLRLGENSSLRMITNRLIDTRMELEAGSAVIEAAELGRDHGVTMVVAQASVVLRKKGIYRFDTAPAKLRVFDGEALVEDGHGKTLVSGGKMLALDGSAQVAHFDRNDTDELDRWSRRRGELIARANVSAANSLRQSGYSLYSSAWGWNPYYGMWTFLPYRGSLSSPYGYRYWSPVSVAQFFYTPRSSYSGGYSGGNYSSGSSGSGYSSMPASSSGYSGAADSASSAAPSHSVSTSASGSASSSIGQSGGSSGGGGGGHHR